MKTYLHIWSFCQFLNVDERSCHASRHVIQGLQRQVFTTKNLDDNFRWNVPQACHKHWDHNNIVLPAPSQDLDASIFWRKDFEKHCTFVFPLTNIVCTPDEHVEKVDEGEFNEGGEDGHEAHDDEDVQGGGISYLRFWNLTVNYKCVLNVHIYMIEKDKAWPVALPFLQTQWWQRPTLWSLPAESCPLLSSPPSPCCSTYSTTSTPLPPYSSTLAEVYFFHAKGLRLAKYIQIM